VRFLLRVVLIVNSSDGAYRRYEYRRYDMLGGVLLSNAFAFAFNC